MQGLVDIVKHEIVSSLPDSSIFLMGFTLNQHLYLCFIVTTLATLVTLGIPLWIVGSFKFNPRFILYSILMGCFSYLIRGILAIPANLALTVVVLWAFVRSYSKKDPWICLFASIASISVVLFSSLIVIDRALSLLVQRLSLLEIMTLAQIFEPLAGLLLILILNKTRFFKDFINSLRNIDSQNRDDKLMVKVITELLAMVFIQFSLALLVFVFKDFNWRSSSFQVFIIGETLVPGFAAVLLIQQFFVFRQIKEQKMIEERLTKELADSEELTKTLRAQKHDFNNQLNVVLALADMGQLEQIRTTILDYTGDTCYDRTRSDLLCSVFLATLTPLFDKANSCGIETHLEIITGFTNIPLSPAAISRITMNLVRNALDAHGANNFGSNKWIDIYVMQLNGYWILEVKNNGPVISQSDIQKIFDTGFSTKGNGDRGYGLSIVKQLVEECGGMIDVTSDRFDGTSFKVSIPLKTSTKNSESMVERTNAYGVAGVL